MRTLLATAQRAGLRAKGDDARSSASVDEGERGVVAVGAQGADVVDSSAGDEQGGPGVARPATLLATA